jgi:hypothetical protein
MRKLLTFLIALGAVALGVCSPASSQGLMTLGAGSVKGAVAGGGVTCTSSTGVRTTSGGNQAIWTKILRQHDQPRI